MDNKVYLTNNGWVETPGNSPWRWSDPKFPSAFYRENDARDLQQSRDREACTTKGKK